MQSADRRKERRLGRQFPAVVHCGVGPSVSIDGVSENLSQNGAFIKTREYQSCKVNDRTVVTFFLPPDFTGQDQTIGLQGAALIVRVDQENEGVGLQFLKSFKHFDRITVTSAPRKIKYKKLAHYLSNYADAPLTDFTSVYPNGFLVERSERFFDRGAILQFTTEIIQDRNLLDKIKKEAVHMGTHKARVIELKRKEPVNDPNKITVGRSPDNDIVLYNKLISRNHAYLSIDCLSKTCYVVDLSSTNGTFLNNSQITSDEKQQLADGDEISFGPETRVIYFSSEAFHRFLTEIRLM